MKFLYQCLGVLKWFIPLIYCIGALPIWLSFAHANPDGLANLGLIVYTLPIVFMATYVLGLEFPYFSGNYIEAHALYFWPAVMLLAALLFLIFHGLQIVTRPSAAGR
ncbi:MAG TPA: hypothetical protein PLG02_08910 [Methylotenera sp.]|nr:hypothetical protein [Methylotenera sp.]